MHKESLTQLNDFPALDRFCGEMNLESRKLLPHSIKMLVDIVYSTDPEEYPLRSHLNECFQVAYDTNGMTNDRRAKLAHPKDFSAYKSAIGELKIAWWLSSLGAKIIQWDPPCKNGLGELLISLGGNEIFVEVKTFFGASEYTNKGKTADLVAQDIAGLRSKIGRFRYHVRVIDNGSPYRTGSIKPLIKDMLRQLGNGEEEMERQFRDKELCVEITIQRDHGNAPVWSTSHFGSVDQCTPLRDRLEHAQRSATDIASVVCIYDFDWQLQDEDRELPDGPASVLFGTHVSNYTGRGPSQYRKSDGLWKEGQTSSLNAVFVYSEKFTRDSESGKLQFIRIISGYLSPAESNLLTKDYFNLGVTRWIDNDLPYFNDQTRCTTSH